MPREQDPRTDTWSAAGQEENEKFRTFFSNSVAQIPKNMTEPIPEKKVGFLARLFGKKKQEDDWADEPTLEQTIAPETGEIFLEEREPEAAPAIRPAPQPDPEPQPDPRPEPREEKRYTIPEEEKRAPGYTRGAARHAAKKPARKGPGLRLFGSGEDENTSAEPVTKPSLADPDDTMSLDLFEPGQEELAQPLETPAAVAFPQSKTQAAAQPEPAPAAKAAEPAAPVEGASRLEEVLKAAAGAKAEQQTPAPAEKPAESSAPEQEPQELELPVEPAAQAAETPAEKKAAEEKAAETTSEEARHARSKLGTAQDEEEPQTPEEIGESLHRLCANLSLRCALSGVLAAALLGVGLIGEGLLPALPGLDPVTAPVPFMGANLLLLLAAMAVSFNVLRDGLWGMLDEPSLDAMPALATVGALVQALVAVMNAEAYQAEGLKLMSGVAALLLFLATLGERLMAASVRDGFELMDCGVDHQGAYRATDKDLVRTLAEGLEEPDPWILLSRPVQWTARFIEQSFSPRASERSAQKTARLLLVGGLLGAVLMLVTGRSLNAAAAALAAILCLGAPLSATIIAGLASLRMQRTAGAVGAVIPGWGSVEELGGVDTLQVDASELFTPESAQLKDIRIFKGGRIDKAILYAASTFNQGCNTLSTLFREIIENRTDILLPVKDLVQRPGLGFSGWCDNNQILIGTRELMEQEGVPLPEKEYEEKNSNHGEFQLLYLAVSGSLHAMFVLHYIGGRNVARSLGALRRENIRLMVTCQDPSLTAEKIEAAYHLPEGMVTILNAAQTAALAPALAYAPDGPCCMVHLKGFASLVGGLRAAERAQNGENFGTAIQKVSVWFSLVIGLLLAYAGSIGGLSLAVVLMYQAAWSGLSIAAAAMKQNG